MSIEKNIGYFFFDKSHLKRALRHVSYPIDPLLDQSLDGIPEIPDPPFDQMGYGVLGRSLLESVVAEFGIRSGCHTPLDLAQQRLTILDPQRLQTLLDTLCLEFYVKVGSLEKDQGLTQDFSTLEETFMAVLGAVYFDGGYMSMRRVVKQLLVDPVLGDLEAD
jgi:ribonuclease III